MKVTSVSNLPSPAIKPHSVWSHIVPLHWITPSGKHADSKPVPLTPTYHMLLHLFLPSTPHITIN